MRALPAPLGVDVPTLLRRVAKTAVVIAVVGAVVSPFLPARVEGPVLVSVPEDWVRGAPSHARWTGVQPSGGCWFFSGPGQLGRDRQLGSAVVVERSADRLAVAFDGARFEGALGPDGTVVLLRESGGVDGVSAWRTRETLTGRFSNETLVADYGYRECQFDGQGGCPEVSRGDCRIHAAVTVTPTPTPAPPTRQRPKDWDEPLPCVE